MTMPEAPVYENHLASGPKNQVGYPRQRSIMQAVPVAELMNEAANNHFRFSVGVPNASHPFATLGWS